MFVDSSTSNAEAWVCMTRLSNQAGFSMRMSLSLPKYFLLAGTLAGLGLSSWGCQLSFSSVDCSVCDNDALCHNHVAADDSCECDPYYTRSDPDDPEDLECIRIPTKPTPSRCVNPHNMLVGDSQCQCEPGYIWCDPSDEDDLTCCEDPTQVSVSDTG